MPRNDACRGARSPLRFAPLALVAMAASAALAIAWPPAVPTNAPLPGAAGAPASPGPEPAVALAGDDHVAAPAEREPAPTPALVEPSFEQRIDELVALGRRTAEFAQQDEVEAATASDREARARFDELMARHADAGERALAAIAALPDPASDVAGNGHRIVLQLVLDHELLRRDHQAAAAGDRTRIDVLTQVVLDTMPTTAAATAAGERALVERPYLRGVHEPAVLALLRLAAEDRFPRATATALLTTLWRNLERFGERSSDELSRLALLWLGDADPSQRTAACRHLLGDARYRHLVVTWLRERGDQATACEVAGTAAGELPPDEALAVLRALGPVLPRATSACLVLGFRAPDVVADAYREALAANTQPDLRRDLLTGVGMTPTALGVEIAELALAHDPSPDVRVQAVFVLTARAGAEAAERAVATLLDDPAISGDPLRLGAVVVALRNLEAGGHANALQRLGARLRLLPLDPDSRAGLEQLLQRGLPGGTAANPAQPR